MSGYGPEPADYMELPGPARFVQSVTGTLMSGNTAVVVFPDSAVDSGLADAVLVAIGDESGRAYFCESDPDEPFHTRVLTTFGVDKISEREYDDWERIVHWEPWHGSWLILPAWDHADIDEILKRWPAQVHAAGLSPASKPALLVGVRLSDLDRSTVDHLDRAHLSVHWWWGVLDHLDTQTRVATVTDRRLNPVDAAVITDIAVWDLACVDYLAAHWDRTTSGLPEAVMGYQATDPWDGGNLPTSTERRPTNAPPATHENAWRCGLVDQWGHTLNRGPRVLNPADVRQRLWLAHNRTLILHVDTERGHFERLIRAGASAHDLRDLHQRDDDIIEIGSLTYLVDRARTALNREERDRLYAFRDLRNALAHRIPVNDILRTKIMSYIGFD